MTKGATLIEAKGIIIGEKRARDETPDILPLKKGKQVADTKKKGSMPPPNDKQNGPTVKAPAKSKATSSRAVTKEVLASTSPREGTWGSKLSPWTI